MDDSDNLEIRVVHGSGGTAEPEKLINKSKRGLKRNSVRVGTSISVVSNMCIYICIYFSFHSFSMLSNSIIVRMEEFSIEIRMSLATL